jgi:hypothetical protein
LGLPISQLPQAPALIFKDSNSKATHWATSSIKVSNTFNQTSLVETVSCSFAGGCLIQIDQAGLFPTILSDPEKNRISVCNDICIISEADSNDSVTSCQLTALATLYSASQYNMTTNNYLIGTPFASNTSLTMAVWDNDLQNGFTDPARYCFFGTGFRVGYVGLVNEVKFFMNRFTRSNFVNKL